MTKRADESTGAASPDPVDPDNGESHDGPLAEHAPGAASVAGLADVLEGSGSILTDVVALTNERDEYLGALQRLQADFENYRKRVLRQQEEQSARAALGLVDKVLPVLDALDLAQGHLARDDEGEPSEDGQALIQARAMLIDTLKKEGLERVDEVGVPFDPSVHDAVAHSPADETQVEGEGAPTGTVVDEVLRSGYVWRGQMLRPAMVRVKG